LKHTRQIEKRTFFFYKIRVSLKVIIFLRKFIFFCSKYADFFFAQESHPMLMTLWNCTVTKDWGNAELVDTFEWNFSLPVEENA